MKFVTRILLFQVNTGYSQRSDFVDILTSYTGYLSKQSGNVVFAVSKGGSFPSESVLFVEVK